MQVRPLGLKFHFVFIQKAEKLSIELLYVFPSWVENVYKQKDYHLLFGLLNVGTLKLPPNMATLMDERKIRCKFSKL